MELTLETRAERGWTVLDVAGELDLHTCITLAERLRELSETEGSRVAVNMARVSFMDSSSLGALVDALKRLRDNGGNLALVGVSGSPLKVLTITGLDQVIPNFASVAELPQD